MRTRCGGLRPDRAVALRQLPCLRSARRTRSPLSAGFLEASILPGLTSCWALRTDGDAPVGPNDGLEEGRSAAPAEAQRPTCTPVWHRNAHVTIGQGVSADARLLCA